MQEAKTLLEQTEPAPTEQQLDDAKEKLAKAAEALNGVPTKKDALTTAVNKAEATKGTDAYKNATPEEQKTYTDVVAAGQQVLDNANATQAEVNAALENINTAKAALSGAVTDKTALTAAVNEASTVKASDTYNNATDAEKQAYDKAITEGQRVLNNADATQAEVDAAKESIDNAIAALSGKVNKASLEESIEKAKGLNISEITTDPEDKAVVDALNEAKDVLNNPDATQGQVDEAKINLKFWDF